MVSFHIFVSIIEKKRKYFVMRFKFEIVSSPSIDKSKKGLHPTKDCKIAKNKKNNGIHDRNKIYFQGR